MTHVLLSTAPDDISLYNKPMARNAQIWSHEYELLLDGPRATPGDFQHVADRLAAGGPVRLSHDLSGHARGRA